MAGVLKSNEAEGEIITPKDIVTGCIPSTHTYQDYLNAWTHFCSSQAVTDADRHIARESVCSYSVVTPCKALK
ncbi:hypothetical protein GWK90_06705 [Candidatus Hamiltonella defensa]|uniref:Uncharacterized protein n=1 Tax=Candidatus Williamhamiltonella defendens TaxID=138072 RepID=A0AAC9YF91_9ENTR|nr:hypothetical protein CJJ18_01850 [Candidatus Hamiltonella defensa]AWK16009.1 hypothetical protein CCS40_01830 [Candidatus Hamiltonella defensa]MBK4361929.1 hypothetical protein [Candidatus Hamiltonella defensa]